MAWVSTRVVYITRAFGCMIRIAFSCINNYWSIRIGVEVAKALCTIGRELSLSSLQSS